MTFLQNLAIIFLVDYFEVDMFVTPAFAQVHSAPIEIVKLSSTDPYERGLQHGELLKNRIHSVYSAILRVLSQMPAKDPTSFSKGMEEMERCIPEDFKAEMRGLAEGSQKTYQDVLRIHTFLDLNSSVFACTAMAVKKIDEVYHRIVAANHKVDELDTSINAYSKTRREAFLAVPIPEKPSPHVLKATNFSQTIQSMILDPTQKTITISSACGFAADREFKKHKLGDSCSGSEFSNSECNGPIIYRNLDWFWNWLGGETIMLTRVHDNPSNDFTCSVTFPGYIGALSGMNSRGLSLVANTCGGQSRHSAVPNTLWFMHILDRCSNLVEANKIIREGKHATSMNIIVADPNSAASYELEGDGTSNCVGIIGEQVNVTVPVSELNR